jgi:hypothetical protein
MVRKARPMSNKEEVIFDLGGNEEGEWFPFQASQIDSNTGEVIWGDPVPNVKVKIRSWKPFFEAQIEGRKRQVEHVFNPKSKAMERISFIPELSIEEAKKERDNAYDYAITGFENLKGRDKQLIACTRENKIGLMKNPVFERFFVKCQQVFDSAWVTKEALIKN